MWGVFYHVNQTRCWIVSDTVSDDNDLLHSSWRSGFRWRLEGGWVGCITSKNSFLFLVSPTLPTTTLRNVYVNETPYKSVTHVMIHSAVMIIRLTWHLSRRLTKWNGKGEIRSRESNLNKYLSEYIKWIVKLRGQHGDNIVSDSDVTFCEHLNLQPVIWRKLLQAVTE